MQWGIEALVEEGMQYWEEHKHAPNVQAMKMRSRKVESESLMDVKGLGAFTAFEIAIEK